MRDPATSAERTVDVAQLSVSVLVVLCIVAATFVVGAFGTRATAAAPQAIIAVPGTASTPLPSGGSGTPFTVVLPVATACPGDTAHAGNHVYSFLVHDGTDLSTLTFQSAPSTGFGLVDRTGTYYGPVNTAIGTGEIIGIPNDFVWGPLITAGGGTVTLAQLLYQGGKGVWETGLACADTHGALNAAWSVPITFTASSTDPLGFVWAADEAAPPTSTPVSAAKGVAASAPPTTDRTAQGADSALGAPGAPAHAGSGAAVPPASATTTTTGSGAGHSGVSGSGAFATTASHGANGWLPPLGLGILAAALAVGVVWLARRQRAKKATNTESV